MTSRHHFLPRVQLAVLSIGLIASFAIEVESACAGNWTSTPTEFSNTPQFGTAQLDSIGRVQIATFFFDDPDPNSNSQGKVFRQVHRHAIDDVEVYSMQNRRLTSQAVQARLRHPTTILWRNDRNSVQLEWLKLFKPDTLLVWAPPSPQELEELDYTSSILAPRYGDKEPQFVFAFKELATTISLRILRTETRYGTTQLEPADPLRVHSGANQPKLTAQDLLEDIVVKKDELKRIRSAKESISFEPVMSMDNTLVPGPALLFQTNEPVAISKFYLSVLNCDALILACSRQCFESSFAANSVPASTPDSIPVATTTTPPGINTSAAIKSAAKPSKNGEFATTTTSAAQVARLDPAVIAIRVKDGLRSIKTLVQQRNFEKALSETQMLNGIDPENATLLYLKAFLLKQLGRLQDAQSTVVSASQHESGQPLKDWYERFEWLQGPSRAWLDHNRKELLAK